MKKWIAAAVVLLVLAYPAATWWSGRVVEARVAEQYKTLEKMPFVKLVKRDYQRGFASSTEVATFEVFGDLIRSVASAGRAAPPDGQMPQPLLFTVRSQIAHGPFAAGQLASAVVDSELEIDAKTAQELSKLFGDKKPLAVHTVFGFDQSGRTTVESPAFTHVFDTKEAEGAKLAWGGLKLDIGFARGGASFTLQGTMPKIDFEDRQGARMLVSELRMTGEQQRLFDDEPLLYGGTQRFEIAAIDIAAPAVRPGTEGAAPLPPPKPVRMKNLSYVVEAPVKGGDFLDVAGRMAAASFMVDQQEFGPVHYDVSMRHLHARSFAALYRAALQAYSDPMAMAKDPTAALAALREPGMALLGHDPEISIDRISFHTAQGDAQLSAAVKLVGATAEDMAQPPALLAKLDAVADLKLPAAMLAEMMVPKAPTPDMQAAADMAQRRFTAQIEALTAQGYVTNDKGMLASKLAFKGGQLTINGKPFDPRAMGGPRAAAEAEAPDMPAPPPAVPPKKGR